MEVGFSGNQLYVRLNQLPDHRRLPSSLSGSDLSDDFDLGLDLKVFQPHVRRIGRGVAKHRQSLPRLLIASDFNQPTRGEWHEEETDSEDEGGNQLNPNRKPPCNGLLAGAAAGRDVGVGIESGFTYRPAVQSVKIVCETRRRSHARIPLSKAPV